MDADGDFVVIWQSDGQDGGGWGIYGSATRHFIQLWDLSHLMRSQADKWP
jgi:hypothetical protein